MFKLVVSLALIAACSANLYVNDADYHVNVGRDHIIVTNHVGHQVHFLIDRHSGYDEQILVHVTQEGQVLDSEKIVNHPVTLTGQYEADILYQIFDNFRGTVDEISYEKLLHIVAQHVQDGHVHPIVLYALQMLAHQQHNVELLSPHHQQYYNTVAGMFHHIGYGQNQLPYSQHQLPYGQHQLAYGQHQLPYGQHQLAYGQHQLPYGQHQLSYSQHQLPYSQLARSQGYGAYQTGVSGLGHYGSWYGAGRQGYHYPGVYGQEWQHQANYGPYSSSVWGHLGQGYGHHYGYGSGVHQPYGGHWSQWQGAPSHMNQLWVH